MEADPLDPSIGARPAAHDLLLEGVRVVDVRAGTVSAPMDVRLLDGRIASIVAAAVMPAAGLRSSSDRWLVPGLIDAHQHLAWDAGDDPVGAYRAAGSGADAGAVARRASAALRAGVTTIRDLGGPPDLLPGRVGLRSDVAGPPAPGDAPLPDILHAGPPITRHGGHLALFGGAVASAADATRRVGWAADRGARAVKLVLSGGGLTPGTHPEDADLPVAIARAAVRAAHGAGLRVAAHCHATAAIRVALEAGVDTVEHASCVGPDGVARFEPELARALAGDGIAVVPTAVGALRTAARYRLAGGASPTDRGAIARLEARAAFTPRWAEAGVTLVAGTDAGVTATPFDTLPDELAAWITAGLSPAAALRGATLDAALALGLADRGEVRTGQRADLLLVDADPMRDPATIQRPLAVLVGGRPISRGAPGRDRSL